MLSFLVLRFGTPETLRLGMVSSGPYWNLVALSWLPLYAVLYLAPRLS